MNEETRLKLTPEAIAAFGLYLRGEDHALDTIKKYLRDLKALSVWLAGRPVTKELGTAWREHLLTTGHEPVTVNSMLAALNRYVGHCGQNWKVKFLKIQRRVFRDAARELDRGEYEKLVETARADGQERLALLMEAICSTGIRVSEVKYLTVAAARRGRAEISLKGKVRVIMLTNKLCRKLLKYTKKQKIASGEIFVTRSGRTLSRRQIWGEMKRLCEKAGVPPEKVYPHNLRHLFARTFYRACRDIVKLADVLGHSNIETTRIYLITTGAEHLKQMDKLGLVS